ncbi:MAG: T9SS type A sorting domain-containing protein, partial [Chitinophagaceae bacterium]|nr:T9SS type A sorting domain-containing protein [Chitinophagaceae bacterium]
FSGYEIEKSTDGIHFEGIASKSRQGTGSDREFYNYMDDLSAATEKAFFYRLKMVDLDGKFTYSNIIVLRKDGIKTGISISPNPVVSGGLATARIEASKKGTIEIEILDMAGRIVLRQQNQVFEGTNSIALNQLSRLQPGIYILRAKNGEEVVTERLSIAR